MALTVVLTVAGYLAYTFHNKRREKMKLSAEATPAAPNVEQDTNFHADSESVDELSMNTSSLDLGTQDFGTG